MRNPFRRRNGTGDTPTVVMPQPVQVDWRKYHAMNAKRATRGAPPIPADEFEQSIRAAQQPQRRMTRAEVEASQVWLLKHNREPLTDREILELQGVNMSDVQTDFDLIESNHQAALAKAEAEIARMAELGMQISPDAMAKAREKADQARDQAIAAQRETLLQAVTLLREGHPPLRWQARLNATPPVDDSKARQMAAILAGVKSFADLRRLHAEALAGMNPDEAGAFYLETHGAAHLNALPGRDDLTNKMEAAEWRKVAETQRDRRAGEPLRRIQRDEADLKAAIDEANRHPTSREIQATAHALGVKVEFTPGLQANLRLPPADPIFE